MTPIARASRPIARADPLGEVLVADGAERHVAGERRASSSPSADELAGLLVGGDQHQLGVRPARAPPRHRPRRWNGPRQLADLLGRGDVE